MYISRLSLWNNAQLHFPVRKLSWVCSFDEVAMVQAGGKCMVLEAAYREAFDV